MVLTYFVGSPDFDRFELFVGGRCALFVSLFWGNFRGLVVSVLSGRSAGVDRLSCSLEVSGV